ncbi:MAG: ammonium transporter [Clostridium sp.]|nr:ammonium transporter [Clostridium sp.]
MSINSGDTAFIIISTALVFLMTPALCFFYGGMVRRKNVLNTILSSFFICGLASVLWVIIGYSLSFGEDINGFIGGFNHIFFNGVSLEPSNVYATTIPEALFASFQMMFSIITPALITGSLIGRMKFKSLFIFIGCWLILVYYPLAHMVWGDGGFIANLGALDFAGGNVVHISSGVSGLVACILLGKRREYGMLSYKPHNIPFVFLGAALLWFGWFGFNAGSALGANGLAVHAFLTTNTSAGAALLSWMLIEKIRFGKTTLLGAATGGVVGLVAITPGAGFVPIWSALIIGFLVSPICFFCMSTLKSKFGYDDALDAFGCHGVGGIWGGIATGIFADSSINPIAKWNGLFFGDTNLFIAQVLSIIITIAFAAILTFIIIKVIQCFMDIRVSKQEEANGMDLSEHSESAYPSFMGLD